MLIIGIVSTIDVVLIVELVSIVVVLIARNVFTKDTLITFRGVIIILIVRFILAKVLFVNILFANIKTN